MADFVAVLKKTLDGLSGTTPQMREKVYEKARITIAAKLAAMNPPLPEAVILKQKQALEEAIVQVEAEFSAKHKDPLAELESVFASLKNPAASRIAAREAPPPQAPSPSFQQPGGSGSRSPQAQPAPVERPPLQSQPTPVPVRQPPVQAPAITPDRTAPANKPALQPMKSELDAPLAPQGKPADAGFAPPPGARHPHPSMPSAPPMPDFRDQADEQPDDEFSPTLSMAGDEAATSTKRKKSVRDFTPIFVMGGLAVVLIGAIGAYLFARESVTNLVSEAGKSGSEIWTSMTGSTETPEPTNAGTSAGTPVAPGANEQASASANAPTQPENASAGSGKFTQRLNPDGSEVDAGPGEGASGIAEGQSMAAATPSAQPDIAAPQQESAQSAAPGQQAEASGSGVAEQAVPVAQQSFFYYEQVPGSSGFSREQGTVVWSLVQESPGDDMPPEAAIRAEVKIPEKNLELRLKIRRNVDKTLPFSHMVELIFITPPDYEGGGLEKVAGISMNASEAGAGKPVLGVAAKFNDGLFLFGLNDRRSDIATNMALIGRQTWMDVDVQYKSGRRAMFAIEKGIPGAKIFDEALKSWGGAVAAP